MFGYRQNIIVSTNVYSSRKKDLDRVIESFNNEWDSVTNKHFK